MDVPITKITVLENSKKNWGNLASEDMKHLDISSPLPLPFYVKWVDYFALV